MINRRRFGNNKTGYTGVVRIEDRFDYEGIRYRIGRFDTEHDAKLARDGFITLFFMNRDFAIKCIEVETVWVTSKTKIRGITQHKDGGYVARVTEDNKRIYLGYFKTIEEAFDAKCEFYSQRDC